MWPRTEEIFTTGRPQEIFEITWISVFLYKITSGPCNILSVIFYCNYHITLVFIMCVNDRVPNIEMAYNINGIFILIDCLSKWKRQLRPRCWEPTKTREYNLGRGDMKGNFKNRNARHAMKLLILDASYEDDTKAVITCLASHNHYFYHL